MNLENYIRDVKDFPKEGIIFKDISPLLAEPKALQYAIDTMCTRANMFQFDRIGAFDARGFLFGPAMAYKLNKPFFMLRKSGKLPYETIGQQYGLEYGEAEIEIHTDSVKPGERVILVDDLLATGGTMKAGANLVERLGGKVASCLFLTELEKLEGRMTLQDYRVDSLIKY